jgi:hypothetical protein
MSPSVQDDGAARGGHPDPRQYRLTTDDRRSFSMGETHDVAGGATAAPAVDGTTDESHTARGR